MNLLNDTFIVKYDDALQSIVIVHPDESKVPAPVVRISCESVTCVGLRPTFLEERHLTAGC
jgi:hypothetical protein